MQIVTESFLELGSGSPQSPLRIPLPSTLAGGLTHHKLPSMRPQTICKSLAFAASGLALILAASGCSSTRFVTPPQTTTTAVALNAKNYRLIKAGATGTSCGFRLLGILPFSSPHHSTARSKLYASVDQPLTGKAVALTNELEDRSTLYLILFSVPKLTITADVIEFVDHDEAPASKAKP
jgi:hypothetical protein